MVVKRRIRLDYKKYEGSNVEAMPQLKAKLWIPTPASLLMQFRLMAMESSKDFIIEDATKVRDELVFDSVDTGDCFAYHPDGKAKLVLNAPHFRDINPTSRLHDCVLALPDGMYEELEGVLELSMREIKRYYPTRDDPRIGMTKDAAKKNPIWQALARGNQARLDAYVDLAFAEEVDRKPSGRYISIAPMGIAPEPHVDISVPVMSNICLVDIKNGSAAIVNGNLKSLGNVIGVHPEYVRTTASALGNNFGDYIGIVRLWHWCGDMTRDFDGCKRGFIEALERAIKENLPEGDGVTNQHLKQMIQLAQNSDLSDIGTVKTLYRTYDCEIMKKPFDEQELFKK